MSSTKDINLTNWNPDISIEKIPTKDPLAIQIVTKYILHGELQSNGFFRSLMENNLARAIIRADASNLIQMKQWALWMINHAPEAAWGSKESVNNWIKAGGIFGKEKTNE